MQPKGITTSTPLQQLAGKRIAIVGAGPAGLTLARLLQLQGLACTVYEADTSAHSREQGGSLDLHQDAGLVAIEMAQLQAEFEAVARPEGQHSRIFNPGGEVLLELGSADEPAARPEIDRSQLRHLLLQSLDADTVRWDHRLRQVIAANTGYRLQFANGSQVMTDIVFGCDGAWSAVRALRTPIQPIYSGVSFIETRLTPAASHYHVIAGLVGSGNILVLGDNKGLLAQRNGDGQIRIYVALRVPEDWVRSSAIDFKQAADTRTRLLQLFAGWSPPMLDLLRCCDDVFIPRPLYTLPAEQSWSPLQGLTLLGDAAHLMPPFTGRGANMAMLDAVELAACLNSSQHASAVAAMDAYERTMLLRMNGAISETLASQDLLISADVESAVAAIQARKATSTTLKPTRRQA